MRSLQDRIFIFLRSEKLHICKSNSLEVDSINSDRNKSARSSDRVVMVTFGIPSSPSASLRMYKTPGCEPEALEGDHIRQTTMANPLHYFQRIVRMPNLSKVANKSWL